jgi:hypothetical protein
MKFAKSLLIGSGSVLLAGFILTLLAPKALHAVVATLVQVVNTTANPVPNTDVNAPGEEAFQTQICSAAGTGYACSSDPDNFVVPASTLDGAGVKRLVLTTVTGYCNRNSSTDVLEAQITVFAGGTSINYFSPFQPNPTDPGFDLRIMGPAPLYADPGSSISVFTSVSGGGAFCVYTLAGYYVTH